MAETVAQARNPSRHVATRVPARTESSRAVHDNIWVRERGSQASANNGNSCAPRRARGIARSTAEDAVQIANRGRLRVPRHRAET